MSFSEVINILIGLINIIGVPENHITNDILIVDTLKKILLLCKQLEIKTIINKYLKIKTI